MNNKIKLEGFPLLIEKDKAEQLLKLHDAIYFVSGQLEQFRDESALNEAEHALNKAIDSIGFYLFDRNVWEHEAKTDLDSKFRSVSDYLKRFDSHSEELRIKKRKLNK